MGNDFSIECSDGGCVNSQITITSTNDLGEIKCSESGCIGTTFDISYALTASISIETIDCDGEDACKDAAFTFNGDIRVDKCKCGEVGDEDFGCDGTSGLTTTQCEDGGIDVNILAANAIVENGDVDDEIVAVDDVNEYSFEISLSANALQTYGVWLQCVCSLILLHCFVVIEEQIKVLPLNQMQQMNDM